MLCCTCSLLFYSFYLQGFFPHVINKFYLPSQWLRNIPWSGYIYLIIPIPVPGVGFSTLLLSYCTHSSAHLSDDSSGKGSQFAGLRAFLTHSQTLPRHFTSTDASTSGVHVSPISTGKVGCDPPILRVCRYLLCPGLPQGSHVEGGTLLTKGLGAKHHHPRDWLLPPHLLVSLSH